MEREDEWLVGKQRREKLGGGERVMWSGIMDLGPGLAGLKSGGNHPVKYSYHLVTIQHDCDGKQPVK